MVAISRAFLWLARQAALAAYVPPDETGERDYINIVDLVRAYLAATQYVGVPPGCDAFNIGTGSAYSFFQIIKAFKIASRKEIPFKVIQRRQGDIATSVASIEKAARLLNWTATHTLVDICESSWNWQSRNPRGYVN
jgi:UDP-glucose 4-epimerase